MARGELPALTGLDAGDEPEVWRAMGFDVGDDGACVIGDVRLRLCGREAGEGLLGWALHAEGELPATIDGIATERGRPTDRASAHPNGAARLDHVVVRTPDLPRTTGALEAAGLEVRRVRDAGPDLRQAFLWAGDVVVEVAGPPAPTGDAPAALWGLVVVVPDLDAVAALPGSPIGSVRQAVQEGRMIATVRRELGSSVPLAFMTPHPRRPAEERE
jgi:hypothetical protein